MYSRGLSSDLISPRLKLNLDMYVALFNFDNKFKNREKRHTSKLFLPQNLDHQT